ncbi:ABC transporter transmembrane subunit [Enterococcus faecalis]|nr:ABC transporter transmembrane subunit [Enterococcus faecalis]
MQNSLGDLNGYVQENMTGFSVLKLYGREKETLEGFKQVNHRLNGFGFKASFISGLMLPLVQMTAYGTYIGVAVLGRLLCGCWCDRSGAVTSVYSIYLAN